MIKSNDACKTLYSHIYYYCYAEVFWEAETSTITLKITLILR